MEVIKQKVCKRCTQSFDLTSTNFYSNGYTPNGSIKWKPYCKSCYKLDRNERFDDIVAQVFPVLECKLCGYNKCEKALEFHHLDPSTKLINIAKLGMTRHNSQFVLDELRKCVVLCANCHREFHAGVTKLEL